ncbi:MAG: ATP-dependent RNA helicase HrpA, partial [Comamonas sp.]|nr:ATP-dependent RNA helicase HrpA [Comamonas sp.]
MNQNQIPAPVIAVVSELVSHAESHASLDNLFMYAEAFGPTPDGSKPVKATAWLRATNKAHQDPLAVLGRLISGYMEDPEMDPNFVMNSWGSTDHKETTRNHVRKLEAVLERCSLKYQAGGYVTRGGLAPSKTLAELIKGRDMPSIHREFDKAMETVESNPREAVTASSNILES